MSDEITMVGLGDKMTQIRVYADEFWGVLIALLKDKYGFTIDDIVFSHEVTHCECCGGELSEKQRKGLSRFTNDFGDFCYAVGRRRLEVENHSLRKRANKK